jgi:hypothetical protein
MAHYDSLYETVNEIEIMEEIIKNKNEVVILLSKRSIYQNDCRLVSSLTKDLILDKIQKINNSLSKAEIINTRLLYLKELVKKKEVTKTQVSNYVRTGYLN